MRDNIQKVIDPIMEDVLGFFETAQRFDLLNQMDDYQVVVVMLGCVFNVVLILLASISVLLIYSLLMVSVE